MKILYTIFYLIFAMTSGYGQCLFSSLITNIGSCELPSSTYQVTGELNFVNPPISGTLVASVDDGITSYDTIINMPFVSPVNFSISNIPSNGNAISISGVFTDDLSCTIAVNGTAPSSCACVADVGTFTYGSAFTNGNAHYINGTTSFSITGNLDHTFANEYSNGASYDTAMGYIAFSCPTTGADLYTDPCFLGILGVGGSLGLTCADIGGMLPNPVYVMPITFYDASNNIYSNTVDNNYPCYETGMPQEVYCLSSIAIVPTSNPVSGQVAFQISGGLPAFHASNYTISNVLPATASVDMSSVAYNGTATLSGLWNDDVYSFTITDDAGNVLNVSDTYLSTSVQSDVALKYFPNPVSDRLNIEGVFGVTDFTVTAVTGEIVLQETLSFNGYLNVKSLVPGSYIIKAVSEAGVSSFRLIK